MSCESSSCTLLELSKDSSGIRCSRSEVGFEEKSRDVRMFRDRKNPIERVVLSEGLVELRTEEKRESEVDSLIESFFRILLNILFVSWTVWI